MSNARKFVAMGGRLRCSPRASFSDNLHYIKNTIALKIWKPKNALHAALIPKPQASQTIRLNDQIAMRNGVHLRAQFIENVLGQFIGELIKERIPRSLKILFAQY